MNKVTTVNLSGNAYVLEDNGYEALRAYLESAGRGLEKNPDKDEILADVERAIAEKFRALLGKDKTVILAKEVAAIIEEMGPVQDDSAEANAAATAADTPSGSSQTGSEKSASRGEAAANSSQTNEGPARRLYKIPDGAMIAGVCNGFAAYLHLDVVLVRLVVAAFVAIVGLITLVIHWFILLPILAYVGLAIFLPAANTPAERAAARGDPSTTEEYIRRAKQGYYESVKTFKNHAARKKWKHDFKQEMRRHAYHAKHYVGDWSHGSGSAALPSFALPVLGLMEFTLFAAAIGLVCLLIKNGAIFGMGLPTGVPLWIGIVAVIFAFQLLVWPLKVLRRAYYFGVTGRPAHGLCGGFFDSVVWLAALVAAVWLADHYIPEVHAFILTLPAKLDHVVDAIKQWRTSHQV